MFVTFSNLDLTQYINETNMSVEHLANILSEKTGSSSWVVVFKALVTIHHLMVHGNEVSVVVHTPVAVVSVLLMQRVIGEQIQNSCALSRVSHLLVSLATSGRSEGFCFTY